MKHDRQITISVGASRLSIQWNKQRTSLSELYDRLSTPTRSAETYEQYMQLPKAEQDKLKDVGGFVAGELIGARRKAANVAGRDVLTLDLDNIPAGAAQTVLRNVDALGCGYCVYSTRKHCPSAPRLRVLVPTDRTMTASEYEPIARKIASYIGMDYADPTTFEASRLMYWPSCSSDAEYIFKAEDRPLLSADGMLATYDDWHDVRTWPTAPGEDRIVARLAAKQKDPLAKDDWIGAFCRTYDIMSAIAAFIPEAYVPCDGFDDRLTYTGGSTTGGAVLYDDGKFLYSHHATDPCSGKLVNAFDLVRLHRFGDQDDDTLPSTPVNRLPSYAAMLDFVKADAQTAALRRKERGEEILKAFDPVSSAPAQGSLIDYLGSLDGEIYTTDTARQTLALMGVGIHLNEITWQAEITGYPQAWSRANAENLLPAYLCDYYRMARMKGSGKQNVADSLDIITEEGRYNPVIRMLDEVQWDSRDRFGEYAEILGIAGDKLSTTLLHKWLWQAIAMATNDEVNPQGADGVLVLQGPQGVGKTSALRELVPIPRMFKEGAKLDMRNKDTYIQALASWICELGELDRTTVKDSAGLKAFITQDMDEYRTPYARKAVQRPRRTCFCGTVNPETYLIDDTGNRRFWTVPVTDIRLRALFALTNDWKRQFWSQMAVEYNALGRSCFRLTSEERAELERRNGNYTRALDMEDELRDLLNWDLPESQWAEATVAAITSTLAIRLGTRPPAVKVGRVLNKVMREDSRIGSRWLHGARVYKLPIPKSGIVVPFVPKSN